ncbi:methylmalonyl Co-A mutase-associated GTPase MeaB [Neobacillus mesonae]|uniref:methylmalonyl Co-A mutase-associated GTPase MeaB n=1 Tax=Neobacillus mesonae TaxID=1193713 RepID=UPI00203CB162|nr:methylmalonyl Co-A mutase-associated GTPase MeaB [Neobacillus mesonae]MCM3566939.1 methylmalonyl Co-A mutase-associated GTPase MeaB [Neobacillus mesonae]
MQINLNKISEGDRLTIAKSLTAIEKDDPIVEDILHFLLRKKSFKQIIGITGPPGSGKSTIVDQMIYHFRQLDLSVGVICIDPSSVFTNGAILGDRVRMQRHSTDPKVFIRSMATRNVKGGLAAGVRKAALLLQEAGNDVVIIETVGVGQVEIDIVEAADTVIVTAAPGLGDTMQTFKAGLMEIGDFFVVNMADRPGSGKTVRQLESTLQFTRIKKQWKPKVLKTIATTGEGVKELIDECRIHWEYVVKNGKLEDNRLKTMEMEIKDQLIKRVINDLDNITVSDSMKDVVQKVYRTEIPLGKAINKMYQKFYERCDCIASKY